MTLPIFRELSDYWRKFPPIHLMLKQFFGAGEKELITDPKAQAQALQQMGFPIRKVKRQKNA